MNLQRGILIVDGHRSVCTALAERLRAAGWYPVFATRSLVEAIPFLDDPLVAVIVCDPFTLGGDSRLTLGLLATSGRPVVALAALPDQADLAACAEAGAAAVVRKGRPTAVLLYALEVAVDAAPGAAGESAATTARRPAGSTRYHEAG
jgi:CheY-like chemotaxis protein